MKWIFFVIAGMGLMSCSKMERFPVELVPRAIEIRSDLGVYTHGGVEITDPAEKAAFLNRNYYEVSPKRLVFHNAAFRQPLLKDYCDDSNTITFISANNPEIFFKTKSIEQSGDTYVVVTTLKNRLEEFSLMNSDFYKYPYLQEQGSVTSYYQQFVGHGNSNFFDLSLVSYKYVKYNDEAELEWCVSGIDYNEFNPDFVKSLSAQDTLAVQEFYVKYESQY